MSKSGTWEGQNEFQGGVESLGDAWRGLEEGLRRAWGGLEEGLERALRRSGE